MIKNGFFVLLIGIVALGTLASCQSAAEVSPATTISAPAAASTSDDSSTISLAGVINEESVATATPTSATAALAENAANLKQETPPVADMAGAVVIALNGNLIAVDGTGVSVDSTTATITAAGTYSLSGSLADGQIIVDTEDEAAVQLILNGVDIRNATGAPLALMNSEETVLILADSSANYLEDATGYTFLDPEEEEPSAALFSNDDLTITGNGALTVTGNYNDAISSDDSITIESGNITVSAVDDGIRGKDYLLIRGGALTVNSGGDGLKSDNDEDAEAGYIAIQSGSIAINAEGDAITAETNVLITGGEFNLASGGGHSAQVAADASAKGIKGLVSVILDGGTFIIDAADDALHSNSNITINGGTYVLATGDDGIHADATVTVNGGDITITQSYEGLESAVIGLNNGKINVIASDDGINVAGGVDGSGAMPGPGHGRGGPGGPPGGEAFTYTGNYYLYINGGTIVVDANGDGIDVNGAIEMNDGVVLVNGPTEQMNGALDYDGTFNIYGGFFVAVGSAGMAQAPGMGSTQNSVMVNLSSALPAGTLLNIQDASGQSVLTFTPSKAYQSVVFSSPGLVAGGEYTLYYGGSATGTMVNGLYIDGTYTPGEAFTNFAISGVTTLIGGGRFR